MRTHLPNLFSKDAFRSFEGLVEGGTWDDGLSGAVPCGR